MEVGDLVNIFAASQHPPGIVIGFRTLKALVFWNNDLHWIGKSKLEVISEDR